VAANGDGAIRAAVFDGVFDEVEQHLLQTVGVRARVQVEREIISQRDVFVHGARLQIINDMRGSSAGPRRGGS